MEREIELTLAERYDIIKYVHQLPCTLQVRLYIDDFCKKMSMDEEESAKYTVTVDGNGETVVSDPSYTRKFLPSELPEVILNAVHYYVDDMRDAFAAKEQAGQPVTDTARAIESLLKKLV